MSVLLILVLTSGAAVQHGTAEQCAAWYPADWRAQLKCTEIVDTNVLAKMDRYDKVCSSLAALAKGNGLVFVSAKMKNGSEPVTCEGFQSFDPSKPKQGG